MINMVKQYVINKASQLNESFHQVISTYFRFWREDIVFTWHWWLELGLTVLPWAVWVIIRKKDSTVRLLCAGFFVLNISSYLDMLGLSLGLWGYNSALIPTIPSYAPWNFSLLPVAAMVFYQYKPTVSPFLKALLFAGFSAFVWEPFFSWLRIYEPMHWRHIYSFPIFVLIYLLGHFIVTRKHYAPLQPEAPHIV